MAANRPARGNGWPESAAPLCPRVWDPVHLTHRYWEEARRKPGLFNRRVPHRWSFPVGFKMAQSDMLMIQGATSAEEVGAWHLVLDRQVGRIRSIGGEAADPVVGPGWGGVRLQLRTFRCLEGGEWTALRHTLLVPVFGTVVAGVGGEDRGNGMEMGIGQVAVIAEGESFSLLGDGPIHLLGLTLDPSYVQVVTSGQILAAGLVLESRIGVVDELLSALVPALHRELLTAGTGGSPYADALAASVAIRMATEYRSAEPVGVGVAAGRAVPFLVRKALVYMNERIGEEISLELLARHVGQSPFHFARAFKDAVGYSPHQYLIRQRVDRAKQMLLVGKRSPAEVAGEVGFCDQSHLTRHFKRVTGTTPSQFMRIASGRARYSRPAEGA